MRLLIVDDGKKDMMEFVEDLEDSGHTVLLASSLSELRSALEKETFDGIVLDLMLPAIGGIPQKESDSGYQAGVYVYKHEIQPVCPGTPFVVLTAMDLRTPVALQVRKNLDACVMFRGIFDKPLDSPEPLLQLLRAREVDEK